MSGSEPVVLSQLPDDLLQNALLKYSLWPQMGSLEILCLKYMFSIQSGSTWLMGYKVTFLYHPGKFVICPLNPHLMSSALCVSFRTSCSSSATRWLAPKCFAKIFFMVTNGQSGNSMSQIYVLDPVWQCPADGLQGNISVAVVDSIVFLFHTRKCWVLMVSLLGVKRM